METIKKISLTIAIIIASLLGVFIYRLPHNISLQIRPEYTQLATKMEPILGFSIYTARTIDPKLNAEILFEKDSLESEMRYIPLWPAYTIIGDSTITYENKSGDTVATQTLTPSRIDDKLTIIYQFATVHPKTIRYGLDLLKVGPEQIEKTHSDTIVIKRGVCTTTVKSDMKITEITEDTVWYQLTGSKITFDIIVEC